MKKTLLLIILFSCTISFAQKKSKEERQAELNKRKAFREYSERDSLNYDFKYCLLLAVQKKFFSKEVDIIIDYGQDGSYTEDKYIRGKYGKKIRFNSVMDALNYMNSIGWDYVDAYALSMGSSLVYHYLLKARDDRPDNFIPKTKRDFQHLQNKKGRAKVPDYFPE